MTPAVEVLVLSFLSLFLELLCIRFLSAELSFFRFFKNFSLMSAFLGLGLGLGLRGSKRDLFPWLWPLFTALALVVTYEDALGRALPLYWNGVEPLSLDSGPKTAAFLLQVAVMVGLNTAAFIPVGQRLGRALDKHPKPHVAYGLDLLGSLYGVLGYAVSSFLGLPPTWALPLSLAAVVPLAPKGWRAAAVLCTAVTAALLVPGETRIWSPYHSISAQSILSADGGAEVGLAVATDGIHYLDLLPVRTQDLKAAFRRPQAGPQSGKPAPLAVVGQHYGLPFRFADKLDRVAVLGAGGGNDVSAALDRGAAHVTAVEIDPRIARLGRERHPERPFTDPRVEVVIDDARAFLSRAEPGSWDVLSFGHLDSLGLLSSFSAVRSDTFVYTREGLAAAYRAVRPGGVLALSFVQWPFVTEKIHRLMSGFEEKPVVFVDDYINTVTWVLVKGKAAPEPTPAVRETLRSGLVRQVELNPAVMLDKVPLLTDDWPFLYLKQPEVAPAYLWALAVLFALAALGVRRVFFSGGAGGGFPWTFFWLGAGFMIVETRAVTELGLLFGSTWLVNAVAISGVLMMNLLAVAAIDRGLKPGPKRLAAGIFAGIALNLLVPAAALAGLAGPVRLAAALVVGFCPLLFSGLLFTTELERDGRTSRALGANMLGGIAGGAAEYACLVVGLKALWFAAAAFYVFAALPTLARKRA